MNVVPNHIVLTTIYDPLVLFALKENILKHGHSKDTACWVIGDTKTPESARDICESCTNEGFECRFVDIPMQDIWGKKNPELYEQIPYGNESRRNIGFLMALEDGCERLITIDDDNFPCSGDFIGGHETTGGTVERAIYEDQGWHNICEHLELEDGTIVFPRGYPLTARFGKNKNKEKNITDGVVGVTAGMWLAAPDIDATAWINGGGRNAVDWKGPQKTVLDTGTWTPINTQNTSILRQLLPAYCCIPMGHPVPGGRIERYGDIWGGYFLQTVMRGGNRFVSFGLPLAEHRRNPHNYSDDLRHEFWGMILTDWLIDRLKEFEPQNDSVIDRTVELGGYISDEIPDQLPNWVPEPVQEFIKKCGTVMKLWADCCGRLAPDLQ